MTLFTRVIVGTQVVLALTGIFPGCYWVGAGETILFALALLGPICLSAIAVVWNWKASGWLRYGPLLIAVVLEIAFFIGARTLSQHLRETAKARGDIILEAMDKYRYEHGQPIEKLSELVPEYLEAILEPPYFDSNYYIRSGIGIGFYAGALVTCDKSIGGEWVCDD